MLTIYKASAGSGKTFQLALHYVKMVLGVKQPDDKKWQLNPLLVEGTIPSRAHRRILAITFTNKATEEMKSRITASLNDIACATDPGDHPYINTLMDEFGCSFDQLRTAAAKALMTLLLDFSFFNVSTIDSFFQTVLRTFAFELGIQGDYNIEIDSKDTIRTALNRLLDDLTNETKGQNSKDATLFGRVSRWLQNRTAGSDGKITIFKRNSGEFNNLVEETNLIFTEDFKPLQAELVKYLDDPSRLTGFGSTMRNIVEEGRQAIIKAVDDMLDAIERSGQAAKMKKAQQTALKNIQKDFNYLLDKISTVGVTKLVTGDYDFLTGMLKGNQPNDILAEGARTFCEVMHRHFLPFYTATVLLKAIPHLEFISIMMRYLDDVRDEDNLLILDDTASHISRIIGGSEIPFIYEHLGSHLHHFLIDEFQDTSRLQWKNLKPLVANSHANGEDSLIIGDIKQAIYRFRNSDSSILGYDLENIDFTDSSQVLSRGVSRTDNCNRRTAHGIVKFNNTIMPTLATGVLGMDPAPGFDGAQVQQMCDPSKAHLDSTIALFPVASSKKDDSEPQPYDCNGDMLSQPQIDSTATRNEVIINEILKQKEQGYRWGDIAVLFDKKKHSYGLVKMMLDRKIPIQSAESLFLKNSSAVRMLTSMLAMIDSQGKADRKNYYNQKDKPSAEDSQTTPKPSKAGANKISHAVFESRYNYFLYRDGTENVSPEEAIKKAVDLSIEAEITGNDKPGGDNLYTTLDQVLHSINASHPATLVALVEAILAAGIIPSSTIESEKDFIAAFTDLAIEYSELHDNDLSGFLSWWESHKDKAAIMPPPNCDAVQLLTIHKAKGLEFECVHLIDFEWALTDNRETAWFDIRPGSIPATNVIDLTSVFGDLMPAEFYPPLLNLPVTAKGMVYPGSPFQDFYENRRHLMHLDALNLAYVALTRARTRLNVYYKPSEKNSIGKVLSETLQDVIKNSTGDGNPDCMVIPADAYNSETGALFMHIDATAEKPSDDAESDDNKAEIAAELAKLYNAHYYSLVRPDMTSLIRVTALENNPEREDVSDFIDEIEDEANNVLDEKELMVLRRRRQKLESTQRGLDLHEILSHITTIPGDNDIEDCIEKAYLQAAESDGFNTESESEYKATIRKMLQNPDGKKWFDTSVKAETELSFHQPWQEGDTGDELHLGHTLRIDRMVENPDGTIDIVDYKFTSVRDLEHVEQVQSYIKGVKAIFPDREVRGYLWYHDLGLIKEVNATQN